MRRFKYIPIALIFFLLSACHDKTSLITMPAHILAMIPYEENQLIRFRGTNDDSFTVRVSIVKDIIADPTCINDCTDPSDVEQIHYLLKDVYTSKTFIDLIAVASYDNEFYMNIYPRLYNFDLLRPAYADVHTYQNTAVFDCTGIWGNVPCVDSVEVNNKTYYNLVKISALSSYPYIENDVQLFTAFYTKEKGIIQLNYKDRDNNDSTTYNIVE